MEREKIKLTNEQWRDLVWELYFEIDGKRVEIKEIQRDYHDSRRHTEQHSLIFKRISDGKYFRLYYETSVKDEMDWEECNYGETEAIEVFPEPQTIIVYN